MELVTWIVSLLALLGTILNAEKHRAGFYLWLVTNLFWTIYDFKIGAYAQGTLFFAYFLLAIRGLIVWKKKR